jgi:hypothetical protein
LLVDLLLNLARYLVALDDLPRAASAAREAVRIRSAVEPQHVQVATAIEHIALVFAIRGSVARAALLQGYVKAAVPAPKATGDVKETATATDGRLAALLREGLAPKELIRLSAEGAALAHADAIALALDECESP